MKEGHTIITETLGKQNSGEMASGEMTSEWMASGKNISNYAVVVNSAEVVKGYAILPRLAAVAFTISPQISPRSQKSARDSEAPCRYKAHTWGWLHYLSAVAAERVGNPVEVGIEYASIAPVSGNAFPTFPRSARKNEISGRDRDKICRHKSSIREWLPYPPSVLAEKTGKPKKTGDPLEVVKEYAFWSRLAAVSFTISPCISPRSQKSARDSEAPCRCKAHTRGWLHYLSAVAEERTGNPVEVGIEYASIAPAGGNALHTFPRFARKNEKTDRDRDKICRHSPSVRKCHPYLFRHIISPTTFALL